MNRKTEWTFVISSKLEDPLSSKDIGSAVIALVGTFQCKHPNLWRSEVEGWAGVSAIMLIKSRGGQDVREATSDMGRDGGDLVIDCCPRNTIDDGRWFFGTTSTSGLPQKGSTL
ncbi:hypothetical protein M0804_004697 [Polistes exclamans]|nr:hypothetical protein M0804_004697 [Polistes exclamans]